MPIVIVNEYWLLITKSGRNSVRGPYYTKGDVMNAKLRASSRGYRTSIKSKQVQRKIE